MEKTMPSLSRQKTFIVENANILNINNRKTILRLVMMGVGKSIPAKPAPLPIIIEHGVRNTPSIHLDNLGRHNSKLVSQIYNIVLGRRNALNEPLTQSHGL